MSEEPHRVGVLDVGCFSAHLVVADRHEGSLLRPVLSHKVRLRLDQAIDSAGRISQEGMALVAAAVDQAQQVVRRAGVPAVVPFATSVIRDAANADEVVDLVAARTGVELRTLSGRQEARLSYLAARHWFGWSAGRIRHVAGRAQDDLGLDAVLVRPDGVVAWAGEPGEFERVAERWFGTPLLSLSS